MAELNGKKGVWRTIGGRRIFIVNGQDLPTAMKESGKFNKKSKEEYFNENFYITDGDFYEEWRKERPDENWNTKHEWGERKRINVYDKKNNKQVAYVKYDEVSNFSKTFYENKINVIFIYVDEKYRRKGIGTQLYKELQKRAGNNDIYFGELSKEGKKIIKNIGEITKVKETKHNKYYWGRIK